MELVNRSVIESMKFSGTVMVFQREGVTSLVTIRILLVDSSCVMERLVNVAGIVDQVSHSDTPRVGF